MRVLSVVLISLFVGAVHAQEKNNELRIAAQYPLKHGIIFGNPYNISPVGGATITGVRALDKHFGLAAQIGYNELEITRNTNRGFIRTFRRSWTSAKVFAEGDFGNEASIVPRAGIGLAFANSNGYTEYGLAAEVGLLAKLKLTNKMSIFVAGDVQVMPYMDVIILDNLDASEEYYARARAGLSFSF